MWIKSNIEDLIVYWSNTEYNYFEDIEAFLKHLDIGIYINEKGISNKDIIQYFYNSKIMAVSKYYGVEFSGLVDHIKNKFEETPNPEYLYTVIAEFKNDLPSKDPSDEIIFSHEDVNNLLVNYLKRYIDKAKEHGEEVKYEYLMNIYYSCSDYSDEGNKEIHLKEASSVMKSFIYENPSVYLNGLIRDYYHPASSNKKHEITIEPCFEEIFGGVDNFERFLNEVENKRTYKKIEEVKSFYYRYKSNGFKPITRKSD